MRQLPETDLGMCENTREFYCGNLLTQMLIGNFKLGANTKGEMYTFTT